MNLENINWLMIMLQQKLWNRNSNTKKNKNKGKTVKTTQVGLVFKKFGNLCLKLLRCHIRIVPAK